MSFSGDYSPGGLTPRARRRARARYAAKFSARKRRQLARGRREPHARSRREALSLHYPVQRVSRERFERRYRECCDTVWEIRFNQAGCDTAWALYTADRRLFDAVGQDALTTNAQRSGALAARQRPRKRRWVQINRKRLADMGLECYYHVRRSGAQRIPGQLDCLRLRMLAPSINCTPPSGASAGPSGLAADATSKEIPPASPAENEPPFGGTAKHHELKEIDDALCAAIAGGCRTAESFSGVADLARRPRPGAQDVPGDVRPVRDIGGRARAAMGLPQDEGRLPDDDGRPALRHGWPPPWLVSGDAMGGRVAGDP